MGDNTAMAPRDRFLAALDHKEADRVPVDLGANESSGIMAVAYNFVFCQVHNIQADVPVENILAMYEEVGSLT